MWLIGGWGKWSEVRADEYGMTVYVRRVLVASAGLGIGIVAVLGLWLAWGVDFRLRPGLMRKLGSAVVAVLWTCLMVGNVGKVSGGTVDGVQADVARIAYEEGVDIRLASAVASVESAYGNVVSRKGAAGVMQLMPGTARGLGVRDRFSVEENVRAGVRYLRSLLLAFGDLRLALAAYNAGPSAVLRYRGVPPYMETAKYVRSVIRCYYGGTAERSVVSRVRGAPAEGRQCVAGGRDSVWFGTDGSVHIRVGGCPAR